MSGVLAVRLPSLLVTLLALFLWLPGSAVASSPDEAVPLLSELPRGFEQTGAWWSDESTFFARFERPLGSEAGPTRLDCIGVTFATEEAAAAFVDMLRNDGYRMRRVGPIGDETLAFSDVDALTEHDAAIGIITFRQGATVGSVFASRQEGTVSIQQVAQVAARVAHRLQGRPPPPFPVSFGPLDEPMDAPADDYTLTRRLPFVPFVGANTERALVLNLPDARGGISVLRFNGQVWRMVPRGDCAWCGTAQRRLVTLEFGYVASAITTATGDRQEFWTSYPLL